MTLSQASGGRPACVVVHPGTPLDDSKPVANPFEFSHQVSSFFLAHRVAGVDAPEVISPAMTTLLLVGIAVTAPVISGRRREECEDTFCVPPTAENDR